MVRLPPGERASREVSAMELEAVPVLRNKDIGPGTVQHTHVVLLAVSYEGIWISACEYLRPILDLSCLRVMTAVQFAGEARREFGVKTAWHAEYAHLLFPEVYEKTLEYATWYIGYPSTDKPLYRRADIEKLAAVIRERDPHGRLLGLLYRQVKGSKEGGTVGLSQERGERQTSANMPIIRSRS